VEAIGSIRDYGIFLLDPEGNILTWNEGARRIEGYSEAEIVGRNFSLFYTESDKRRGHPQAELKEAKKVGRYEEEGWRVRKDGSKFWASIIITKLTDKEGKLTGFAKITRDLTLRKEMEERIRVSEERFSLLVNNVKDYAIFMLDPEGNVASWNEGATKIIGYHASEIIGQYFSIFYREDDIKSGKCEYELREAKLTGRYEDEGWRVRKDGTQLWANVVITAIFDKNRRLIGFAKVTRDLTEKKRIEDRLQRAYTDLEKRIQERTADLARANAELVKRESSLQEAVRVRDEFISIASHELKTPITSLKLQTQMLQERIRREGGSISPEKTAKSLDTAMRQINRLTRLVEDLLDVARAQARKLSFHLEPTDLRQLVEEVIDRLHDQFDAAKSRLKIDLEPVTGNFDRFRLDQVLVNLFTNAIKYAPGEEIRISLKRERNSAVLVVEDSGPGISEEGQGRLFERFERGQNSQHISGLGLGLFISRQIIEGHHGVIRLESEPGEGARFIIELPLNLLSVNAEGRG
jgi:PAS domain S-box-containing protein